MKQLAGKPRVFIGSSTRAYGLVKWLAEQIRSHDMAIPVEWMSGGFAPSRSILQNLMDQCRVCDFAVIFFTRDDEKSSNDDNASILSKNFKGPRDNTIFEAGLFVGGLGLEPERCILVSSVDQSTLPSDLKGVTYIAIEEPPPPEPPYNNLSDDWCWQHLQNVLESIVFSVNKYGELLYRPRLKILSKRQLAERERAGRNCLEKYDKVVINSSEPEDCCDFLLAQTVAQNIKDHIYYDFHFLVSNENKRIVASQWIDLLRILLATYCIGDESYSEGDLKKDEDFKKLLESKIKDQLYTDALKQFKKQLRFYIHESKDLIPFRMTVHNVSSYEKAKCFLRFGDDYVEWFFREDARVATEVLRNDKLRKEQDRENSVFQNTDTFCIYNPVCGNERKIALKDIKLVVDDVCEKNPPENNKNKENLPDLIMQNLEQKVYTINKGNTTKGKELREILMKEIEEIFPELMRENVRDLCFGDDAEIKAEWISCTKQGASQKKDESILRVIKTVAIHENTLLENVENAIKEFADEQLIPVYDSLDKKNFIVKKSDLKTIVDNRREVSIRKIQGLMDEIKRKSINNKSFCILRESMDTGLVRNLLKAIPHAQYLLVTKNGNEHEQALGCITKDDFSKALNIE
jgi:hypothetical protein